MPSLHALPRDCKVAPNLFMISLRRITLILLFVCVAAACCHAADDTSPTGGSALAFPRPLDSYDDAAIANIGAKLLHRAKAEPFNVLATLIFLGAIVHTFLASRIMARSHRYQRILERHPTSPTGEAGFVRRDRLRFRAQLLFFAGEVEAVFGIWLVPLFLALIIFKGWQPMQQFVASVSFAEPVFVTVIMAIAASRPVLVFAEGCLRRLAAFGGGSPVSWWLVILTIGPLLGSFITEPAAMTICALLLSRRFYAFNPSRTLCYATLGLLFVNVSVGGTLTHFAAPPVVMVAGKWGWGFSQMLLHFGWKAALGIIAANALYLFVFARELRSIEALPDESHASDTPVPWRIIVVHLLFIAWTVLTAHYTALVVLGFLFFLAFVEATERHQESINLRAPLLVGFFLAALVVHGSGQRWWIGPLLSGLGEWPLMIGATLLTAVNDNAAITYLASLVPDFSEALKYAVVAGAVAGGGLTVIANAPNPAGQSLLQKHFGDEGVSPWKLFLAALAPTLIMGAAFMLLR
jgi:hypothetical protein